MKQRASLEDVSVNVKFKLSALWIATMFCYVYGDFFSLFVPGRLESISQGRMGLGPSTPLKLLVGAIVMTVPSVMVFLSLNLSARLNRWLNLVFGAIYSLIMLVVAASSLEYWKAFYLYFGLTEVALTVLIVHYAWRWPRDAGTI